MRRKVPPPEGYNTWLQFAISTMETRQVYVQRGLQFGLWDIQRNEMTRAAEAELRTLQGEAQAWRKHVRGTKKRSRKRERLP